MSSKELKESSKNLRQSEENSEITWKVWKEK